MADEGLFEFLHSEIVNYITSKNENDKNTKDDDLSKLEFMGFSMGYRLIERLVRERRRFEEELDIIKFICTDFWSSIYKKQMDTLRTNYLGVYILNDNSFRFLTKMSNSKQYLEMAPKYVAFTCGIIRGVLANLGYRSVVTAEVETMPSCKFHIQVHRN